MTTSNGSSSKPRGETLGMMNDVQWDSAFISRMPDPTRMFSLLVLAIIHVRYLLAHEWDMTSLVLGFWLNPYVLFSYGLAVAVWVYSPSQKDLPVYDRWAAEWYWWNSWFYHMVLDGFTGSWLLVPVSAHQYQMMDRRFITRHCAPYVVGLVELFFMGPVSLWVYRLIVRQHPLRFPVELMLASVQVMGMIFFMGTELYEGQLNVPANDPVGVPGNAWANIKFDHYHITYYWFAFWFANNVWSVVPTIRIVRAIQECAARFKDHQD